MDYIIRLLSIASAALLVSSTVTAQLLPPPPSTYKEWNGPNDTGSWSTGPWVGGSPLSGDHVLFGLLPSSERVNVNTGGDHTIRSLWFQAGRFYTLNGTSTIKLNSGAANGRVLVVTNDATAPQQSETNIESHIQIEGSFPGSGSDSRAHIENWSEGGLRIGGLFKSSDYNVQFGGTGAIHLANRITNQDGNRGNSNFYVQGSTGTQENVHLILSGNNDQTFGGILRVNDRGFVIVKEDQALGEGSNKVVQEGGTVGLRSHLETNLTYLQPGQNNYLSLYGDGIVRIAGTSRRIGALYNDGGWNSFEMRIDQTAPSAIPTGFGARGDRQGGLELRHLVRLTTEFHKLGPGLIVLSNTRGGSDVNQWDKDTLLKAGVLRIVNASSLPTDSNLVFDGGSFGGILELGYDGFSRSLGTGNNQLRWTGDGGFSAHGGARSVSIGTGTLTWASTQHFLDDGAALLLSSRYADSVITLSNAINLNGAQREIRVERGELGGYAQLSGVLSGTAGGIRKTGRGLLDLTQANTYSGATEVVDGALRGVSGNTASNIVLSGGVLGLDAAFTRSLGTGGNGLRWTGSGGFAAYGNADRSVAIGGTGATLTWGEANFLQNGSELRFGHYTANGTVLWDNALSLGNGPRSLRIERGSNTTRADVTFRKAISGSGTLNIYGNGRIDLTSDNSGLSSGINLYGAELRLHGTGKLAKVAAFDIRHGGTLDLVNNTSSTDSDRIGDTAEITLSAGTLRLSSDTAAVSEEIGDLTLAAGANTVSLAHDSSSTELHIGKLLREAIGPRAVFDVIGDLTDLLLSFRLSESASLHAINDSTGTAIIPWATNLNNWLTAETQNSTDHFLKPLTSYYELGQVNWTAAHNVKTSGDTLTDNRTVNSLVLQGDLAMGGSLTISSGGLLSSGGNRTISGSGTITTGGIRPLYIHTASNFTFSDTTRLNDGMDVVKARGGALILASTGTHNIGDLYIHQGTVDIRPNSTLSVRDRISIGDGAGTDRLILPGGRWSPIVRTGGGLPSITLHGTPYDPRGPEYGGEQAILQLGGEGPTYGAGTKQRLANLHIEHRGTIDWRGGEVGLANILWIDSLSFNNADARLFIRNWYEYEDLFLVRRDGFNTALLPQIIFEGYQDYETTWKHYDATYIQITPFGTGGYIPEPSTYGAILGVIGLGLWTWRKKPKGK